MTNACIHCVENDKYAGFTTVSQCKKHYHQNLWDIWNSGEKNLQTCSGVRLKVFFPIVNVMFGILERLLQSITDSPIGLGKLSQS